MAGGRLGAGAGRQTVRRVAASYRHGVDDSGDDSDQDESSGARQDVRHEKVVVVISRRFALSVCK